MGLYAVRVHSEPVLPVWHQFLFTFATLVCHTSLFKPLAFAHLPLAAGRVRQAPQMLFRTTSHSTPSLSCSLFLSTAQALFFAAPVDIDRR